MFIKVVESGLYLETVAEGRDLDQFVSLWKHVQYGCHVEEAKRLTDLIHKAIEISKWPEFDDSRCAGKI